MITAEQFKCEIPSPNALKEGVLYCSTNATNSSGIWSAAGTWAGVAVTIVMALFAWLAWKAARAQLREMQDESKIEALVELKQIHSQLDAVAHRTRQDIQELVGPLRAAEDKFVMLWGYAPYLRALGDFHTCLLDAAYAAAEDPNKTTGKILVYRTAKSRGSLALRRFYVSKKRRIEDLDADLSKQIERLVLEHPGLFSDVEILYRGVSGPKFRN